MQNKQEYRQISLQNMFKHLCEIYPTETAVELFLEYKEDYELIEDLLEDGDSKD